MKEYKDMKDRVEELKRIKEEHSIHERILNQTLTADEIEELISQVKSIEDSKYPEDKRCPVCGRVVLGRFKWVLKEEFSICRSCHFSIAFNTSWCSGWELRKCREGRDWTQMDVAKKMKWTQAYQSKLESSRLVWLNDKRRAQLQKLFPQIKIHQFSL